MQNIFKILNSKKINKKKTIINKKDNEIKLEKIRKYKEQLNPPFPVGKSIVYTKFGEPVLLIKPEDLSEDLLIYRMYINDDKSFICFQINLIVDNEVLQIADIQVLDKKHFRKGYGTLLLEEAIKLAKYRGLNKVTGWMAYDNQEHHERQLAFYKNNGFTILEDNLHFEMLIN